MNETRARTGPTIAGSVLGSYRILDEISSGGMGTVFRAQHVLLERPAAVKLLRTDLTTNAQLVQRFVNEAKAVTACKHPGIVEVYDFGYTPDGDAFIVMELLEGEPLGRRLARQRLGEVEAAVLAHGIASALKAAHRVGVIHRDLKPDNVFLVPDPDGGPDRPKVLDFGIAKLAEPEEKRTRHTQTGVLIGTPMYMAPEQARAAGEIDHRADLYSLGCILYHMLVGRPPFVADGGGEIIALQLFGQVEPPSRLAPVSPDMEQLVLRLLEKEPGDRPGSAGDVANALATIAARLGGRSSWPTPLPGSAELAGELPQLAPPEPPPTEAMPRKRSARPLIVAGIVAVVAGAGLGYALLRSSPPPRELVAPTPPAAPPSTAPSTTPPATAPPATTPDTAASPAAPTAPAAAAGDGASTATTGDGASTAPPRASGQRGAPKAGAGKRAATGSAEPVPDRAIELVRETRTVDPPKPGEHTEKDSPIENDVDFSRKRTPSDPPPSPSRPKDPP